MRKKTLANTQAEIVTSASVIAGLGYTPASSSTNMVLSTAINTISGTSIDFTGIPSWVKKITIAYDNVSTTGTSAIIVQIGSGSVDNTANYLSGVDHSTSATATSTQPGFLQTYSQVAATLYSGVSELISLGNNHWANSCIMAKNAVYVNKGAGSKTISGTLDRIRITTVNGTDTFDSGYINILIEG